MRRGKRYLYFMLAIAAILTIATMVDAEDGYISIFVMLGLVAGAIFTRDLAGPQIELNSFFRFLLLEWALGFAALVLAVIGYGFSHFDPYGNGQPTDYIGLVIFLVFYPFLFGIGPGLLCLLLKRIGRLS